MSRFETGIRLVIAFNEAFNRHDVPAMLQLMSDDCVVESASPAPDGTHYSGRESVTQYWQDFFRLSPDVHCEIEDIFSLGPRCIMRWRSGSLDAAGKKAGLRGVDIFQVREGFISETLSYVKG